MTSKKRILIVGNDLSLLNTRRQVLLNAGFEVEVAGDVLETKQMLEVSTFDLLMLCHSLDASQCENILKIATKVDSGMGLVVLSTLRQPCLQRQDVLVHPLQSPQKLVETVIQLLQEVDDSAQF